MENSRFKQRSDGNRKYAHWFLVEERNVSHPLVGNGHTGPVDLPVAVGNLYNGVRAVVLIQINKNKKLLNIIPQRTIKGGSQTLKANADKFALT
jgi:hypothetical protein